MSKKTLFLVIASAIVTCVNAQTKNALDTLPDYSVLFNDFTHFMDSLLAPRSFTTVNIGVGTGHFQYQTNHHSIEEKERLVLAPAAGYYHKSGFGFSGSGSVLANKGLFTWYQTAATASYDYLKNHKLLTGISFTHFITKDSLSFYTSPLSNQLNAYFSYRGWWLKPAVAAGYGWGSITSVKKRSETLKLLKGTFTTQTTESISDLSVSASVKHDFYWLHVLANHDYMRLTPQVVVTGGTQKYGLEQVAGLSISEKHSTTVLYHAEKTLVSTQAHFQLLALSGRIRAEYCKGIFFLQPQLLFDYYIPEKENKVATAVVINTGILF